MIIDTLNLKSGECIAVVGAGGKTSLCWLLLHDLVERGQRAIFTTTTRIRKPVASAFDVIAINEHPVLPAGEWRTACLASSIDGVPDERPVYESLMPVLHTKLAGFSADQVASFYSSIANLQPLTSVIVEADGARGLLLKAPATHEPVIPSTATTVCVVANLEACGQPLDEHVAHRPERIAHMTGTQMGNLIDAGMMVAALTHPDGGLKGIPAGARRVAVLMQRGEHTIHPEAPAIATALRASGYDQVIVLSPRAQPPRQFTSMT